MSLFCSSDIMTKLGERRFCEMHKVWGAVVRYRRVLSFHKPVGLLDQPEPVLRCTAFNESGVAGYKQNLDHRFSPYPVASQFFIHVLDIHTDSQLQLPTATLLSYWRYRTVVNDLSAYTAMLDNTIPHETTVWQNQFGKDHHI